MVQHKLHNLHKMLINLSRTYLTEYCKKRYTECHPVNIFPDSQYLQTIWNLLGEFRKLPSDSPVPSNQPVQSSNKPPQIPMVKISLKGGRGIRIPL